MISWNLLTRWEYELLLEEIWRPVLATRQASRVVIVVKPSVAAASVASGPVILGRPDRRQDINQFLLC